jgi:peptidoglycan hydrolase-like protein with peptidoglycan-binding domain
VRAVQVELNKLGGARLKPDGDFGSATEAKVRAFQRNRHLGSDGIVDAVIWSRIFNQPPPKLHPRRPETDADLKRRMRVEVPVRQRQLRELKPGKRRTAFENRYEDVRAAIRRLVNPPHAEVSGNRVTGGTPRERVVLAAITAAQLDAQGKRHSFYSQAGAWDIRHAITGEAPGRRSDCSSVAAGFYYSAGLPDPNGENYEGGYTGTIAAHCRQISRAQLRPADFVLFGEAPPYHHVEVFIGLGEGLPQYLRDLIRRLGFGPDTTIGHGSPPVDTGSVYLLADPHFYTAF